MCGKEMILDDMECGEILHPYHAKYSTLNINNEPQLNIIHGLVLQFLVQILPSPDLVH